MWQQQTRHQERDAADLPYSTFAMSVPLYDSEAWTPFICQKKLNRIHIRYLRRIHGNTWQDRLTSVDVLAKTNQSSSLLLLKNKKTKMLRRQGGLHRMRNGRTPSDMYGEMAHFRRTTRRPRLSVKEVCKGDLKDFDVSVNIWETGMRREQLESQGMVPTG